MKRGPKPKLPIPLADMTPEQLKEYRREKLRSWYYRHQAERTQKMREKYQNDEAFRQRRLEYARKWREAHPDYWKQWKEKNY